MAMAMERDEEGKHCPVCGNYFYRKGEYCSNRQKAEEFPHLRPCPKHDWLWLDKKNCEKCKNRQEI